MIPQTVAWYIEWVWVYMVSAIKGLRLLWLYFILGRNFNPKRRAQVRADERDVQGKIVIVTGSNSGIGKQTAKELAARGATVIMACRDAARADEARRDILQEVPNAELVFMKIDMADLESIRSFAHEFKQRYDHLDVLVNNAGIFNESKTARTKDGFVASMGVNYLGPFLLTLLLLEYLMKTRNGRIVFVSSAICYAADLRLDDLMADKSPLGLGALYANSKLAIAMFSKELSKLLAGTGVSTYALCTACVDTGILRGGPPNFFYNLIFLLWRHVLMYTVEEGAEHVLNCVLSRSLAADSGRFYWFLERWDLPDKVMTNYSATKLWELSEKLVGMQGYAAKFTASTKTTADATASSRSTA